MVYDGCIGLYGEDTYLKPTEVIDERECKLLEMEWRVGNDDVLMLEAMIDKFDESVETTDERMLALKDKLAKKIVEKEQDYARGAYVYDEGDRGIYVWVQRAFVQGEDDMEWRSHRVYKWDEGLDSLIYMGSMRDMMLLYMEERVRSGG